MAQRRMMVRVPDDVDEEIARLAEQSERSYSQQVMYLVRLGLHKHYERERIIAEYEAERDDGDTGKRLDAADS